MILLFLFFFLGTLLYWSVGRCREHWSDLSRIPSVHPLAPWTSLWMSWMRWRGLEFEVARAGFERCGPIIRVGPKDIYLASVDAVKKDVYGFGSTNMDKPQFLDVHMLFGMRTMFTSLTAEPHRVRKQRFSRYYTQSFLTSTPHVQRMIASHIANLKVVIEKTVQEATIVDALAMAGGFGMDIFTTLMYGLPRGTNFLFDINGLRNWLDMWEIAHAGHADFWASDFPVLKTVLSTIGLDPVPREEYDALKKFEEWGLKCTVAAEEDFRDGRSPAEDEPSVFTMMRANLLGTQTEKSRQHLNADDPQLLEIAAELLDHSSGFGEVFPSAISAPILFLSRHPLAQQRLREELVEAFGDQSSPRTLQGKNEREREAAGSSDLSTKLASLKYLDAVIHESLRLRMTPPSPNPRMTPTGRTTSIGPFANIPGGTRIQAYPWVLHRDEKYFPDAETWEPERWLVTSSETSAVVNSNCDSNAVSDNKLTPEGTTSLHTRTGPRDGFWGFASGARGCVGRSLSLELLRHFLLAVYSTYTTTIISEADYGKTSSVSGLRFLRRSNDDKLWVRFDRVK